MMPVNLAIAGLWVLLLPAHLIFCCISSVNDLAACVFTIAERDLMK